LVVAAGVATGVARQYAVVEKRQSKLVAVQHCAPTACVHCFSQHTLQHRQSAEQQPVMILQSLLVRQHGLQDPDRLLFGSLSVLCCDVPWLTAAAPSTVTMLASTQAWTDQAVWHGLVMLEELEVYGSGVSSCVDCS